MEIKPSGTLWIPRVDYFRRFDYGSARVDVDPRVHMRQWGPCARKRNSDVTLRRFRLSLTGLRLYHGRRSGDADPEPVAVDGSDPPGFDASIGIAEGWHVHTHATLRRGSLLSSNP